MKRNIKNILRRLGFELRRFEGGAHTSDRMPEYYQIMNYLGVNIVLDVGANMGQFGLALRNCGYRGKIVSFEPVDMAYERLLKNTSGDSLWNVHSRLAIGDECGTIMINVAGNDAMSSSVLEMGMLHKESAPSSVYVGVEEVEIITIDSIFSSYVCPGNIVFLKVMCKVTRRKCSWAP